MDRRRFLSWAGVGVFATSLPMVIAACSSPSPTAEPEQSSAASNGSTPAAGGAQPNVEGFYEVGSKTALANGAAITSAKFAGGSGTLVVVQDPANPEGIVALNATCTHKGCTVEWKDGAFVCPCHAAEFGSNGTVKKGPAKEPLAVFEAKLEGGKVFVKPS
ncbi:MAG: ubiquinol-cytochrome c reductase iron-sulfur subunit [Synechococcales cyanobacterium CRU_2_2]|nr:ubiquinol-cytochrome c reductase iron-sulfur subunit [Synechococcales cyanobacterium CRU_2_2]